MSDVYNSGLLQFCQDPQLDFCGSIPSSTYIYGGDDSLALHFSPIWNLDIVDQIFCVVKKKKIYIIEDITT